MSLVNHQIFILNSLLSGDKYGYQIINELRVNNKVNLLLGSLYNMLKGLEKKGLVKSYWGDDASKGGRRKYYKITAEGEEAFNEVSIKFKTLFI